MIVQDLWKVHYQILQIIFLKEFIKLITETMIIKLVQLNINIATVFLNTQALKIL